MSASVLVTRRAIRPLRAEVMCIEDLCLRFNVPGIPYEEPAMGGLGVIDSTRDRVCVHGVGFLLTDRDFGRLVASEGGGIAYALETFDARMVSTGLTVQVRTLTPRRPVRASRERLPSRRYHRLLLEGAREAGLPTPYVQWLGRHRHFNPPSTLRWRIGRWIFLSTWLPVSRQIQAGVRRHKDPSGHVPLWFLVCFDLLLTLMWLQHDYVHCWIWGRGDGLPDVQRREG